MGSFVNPSGLGPFITSGGDTFLMGYGANILKSDDRGASWRILRTGCSKSIKQVIADGKDGIWALADGPYTSEIYSTVDGGDNWRQDAPDPPCRLADISLAGDDGLWAVGTRSVDQSRNTVNGYQTVGVVLKKSGSGAWRELLSVSSGDAFTSILGLDTQTALATCDLKDPPTSSKDSKKIGVIYRTVDGGSSWDRIYTSDAGRLNIVDRGRGKTIWVAGEGMILKSGDGGLNWEPCLVDAARSLGQPCIVNDDVIWITDKTISGSKQFITRTSDGGGTWSDQNIDMDKERLSYGGVAVLDDGTVCILGSERSILRTTDGVDWSLIKFGSVLEIKDYTGYNSNLAFAGISDRNIDGLGVAILGGGCWMGAREPGVANAGGTGENVGWLVGGNGEIWKTGDGGATWSRQSSGTTLSLSSVAAADELSAWAVGQAGTILATRDGGLNWTAQDSGTGNWLNSVCAVDGETAWVAGSQGLVLKTRDGGRTWEEQASGVENWLDGIAAVDGETALAVGTEGTILKTMDGGATWVRQASGTSAWLHGVCAVDKDVCWVAGAQGTIIMTEDGKHWTTIILEDQKRKYSQPSDYFCVYARDATEAIALGQQGYLMVRRRGP